MNDSKKVIEACSITDEDLMEPIEPARHASSYSARKIFQEQKGPIVSNAVIIKKMKRKESAPNATMEKARESAFLKEAKKANAESATSQSQGQPSKTSSAV